ncbi:MAG: hypothetical protein EBR82_10800 [Caulobacteraceae bacterium]|nr:hypothetical protein [Caulobacteraceae bacterium]
MPTPERPENQMRFAIVFAGGSLCGLVIAGASCSPRGQASQPPRPARPPVEVDWNTARTASVRDLVAAAFVPAGDELVEVSRPGPPLPLSEADGPPVRLNFATRPRNAGDYGLCQATVVTVPINQTSEGPREAIKTSLAYKVVGNTGRDAAREWNDAYEKRLDRLCDQAGPVLPTYDDPGGESFFSADVGEPHQLRFATHALQTAIAQARKTPASVSCDGESAIAELDCSRPAASLAKLDMRRLSWVSMKPCVGRPGWQCVEAKFNDAWTVSLQAEVPAMHSATDVRSVDDVKIGFSMVLH